MLPNQGKFVRNTAVASSSALITTTQPSPVQVSDAFPVGDVLLKSLNIRMYGLLNLTASGAGTIITRGGLQFLRSLRFETDKHGIIINGLDGIMLHNILAVKNGARPVNSDISSAATGTPTFEYSLSIPFYDRDAARPQDTVLDLYVSRPTLTTQYGVVGDFISGGTYSLENVGEHNQEVDIDMHPSEVKIAQDGPLFQPYWDIVKEPINSTVTAYQKIMSYGDRGIKKMFIAQRNGSTFAELANTVIGANNTDRLSLKVNGFPWLDNVQWLALQNKNAERYGFTMPTGMAVIDFTPHRSGGYLHSEALSVVSNVQGNIELALDVTSVSNGQLWIATEAVKPLLPAAQRPVANVQK